MTKKTHVIYKYTNIHNNKMYIGRTCQPLSQRAGLNGQNYKGSTYFWNAIQKYGWDSFSCDILESELDAKTASEREIYWIKYFQSDNPNIGYNIINKVLSDYSDKHGNKISEKLKDNCGEKNGFYGKHHTEQTKQHFRDLFTGKHPTEETRRKMSEARQKHPLVGELNGMYGKHHTEEACKKMREARKINPPKGMLGKHHTEETKKRISLTQKGKIVSEKTRHKISVGRKGIKPPNSVAILHVETGERCSSISEVSRKFGIPDTTLRTKMKKYNGHVQEGLTFIRILEE